MAIRKCLDLGDLIGGWNLMYCSGYNEVMQNLNDNSMEQNQFYIFDLVVYLTSNNSLQWKKFPGGYLKSQLTREFCVSVRFFENKPGNNVLTFEGEYRYRTFDNIDERKSFICYIKETEKSIFYHYNCKSFYNQIENQSIDLYSDLKSKFDFNEIRFLYKIYYDFQSNAMNEEFKPFDARLYLEILNNFIDENTNAFI